MKAPLQWLNDFTDMPQPEAVREFCGRLTMSGSKVEGYEIRGEAIEGVVTARILSIEPHPDADKLLICQVDAGQGDPIQIVTGAHNIRVNDVVPVALHNARLPDGTKIKKGKLRGAVSDGMMCSFQELGFEPGELPEAPANGILILDASLETGLPIAPVLGMDHCVIDFEITSNRPDCFSMEGLGREAALTLDQPFKPVEPSVRGLGGQRSADQVAISNEAPDLCYRYDGRVVNRVKIGPSPRWMQDRIRAAGVRPINNIVDITNYCMLELGQPMHAFDLDKLAGNRIVVRRARPGETLTTLDDSTHTLDDQMLVIADADRVVALAGVMGGRNSEIEAGTTSILLESAVFNAVSVRRSAQKAGLRTEASSRYEKGLDATGTRRSLDRACELIEQLGCGEVAPDAVECAGELPPARELLLRPERINRFLGTKIDPDWMRGLMLRIGCTATERADVYRMPSFRPDLLCEADLAEEVARFYGYNRIPSTLLSGKTMTMGGYTPDQLAVRNIKSMMIGAGYYEVCTYTFGSPAAADQLCLPADSPLREAVHLRSASEENSVMRTSLLPSLFQVAAYNKNHAVQAGAFFEVGYAYRPNPDRADGLPDEIRYLTAVAYDEAVSRRDGAAFYKIKGAVEVLMTGLGIGRVEFEPLSDHPSLHPYRSASVVLDGQTIGFVGAIHPETARRFEAPDNLMVMNLELAPILARATTARSQKKLPRFPAVTRDLAILVSRSVPVGHLRRLIEDSGRPYLETCQFFDVYTGEQIGGDQKSVAFNLVFRKPDATLTDKEMVPIMNRILERIAAATGGHLR